MVFMQPVDTTLQQSVFPVAEWSEEESDRLAAQAELFMGVDHGKCLHIAHLAKGKEPGGGTACIRKVFKESIAKGYGGKITLTAVPHSHIFYLYMGMMPNMGMIPNDGELGKLSSVKQEAYFAKITPFISEIIKIFSETRNDRTKSEYGLDSMSMNLSPQGIERWKEAIDQKKPFVPFKRLEHLRHLMTPAMREELDRVLDIRERTFPHRSAA